MKKVIISLLITAMLFCACGGETPYVKEKIDVQLFPFDMPQAQTRWVTLYYPNQDLTEILAFSQPITATDALYEEIMKALLTGTEEGYVSPFSKGVTCRNIMLVQNILYIDLSWQFNEMPTENYFACISVLASTYTGLKEVSFVNITVEGKQITLPQIPNHPIMLLSQYTGTIQSLNNHYLRHKDSEFSGVETFYGAVYVADETNKYIIPEVKSITVREKGYASALVSHLLAESTAIFPAGFMLSGEPYYDGRKATLKVELICPNQWNYTDDWLGASALVSTLNSLYADIDLLNLTVKDSQGNVKIQLEEKVSGYFEKIKSVVEVLTPDVQGTGIVRTNMLVSSMPGSGGLKNFLKEYLVTLNPDFRNTENIIRAVAIKDNTVIVDLSAEYFSHYERVINSFQGEHAVIYSLISVACAYTGTAKALLLQEGQRRTTIAGYVKIDQPLLNLPNEYVKTIEQ